MGNIGNRLLNYIGQSVRDLVVKIIPPFFIDLPPADTYKNQSLPKSKKRLYALMKENSTKNFIQRIFISKIFSVIFPVTILYTQRTSLRGTPGINSSANQGDIRKLRESDLSEEARTSHSNLMKLKEKNFLIHQINSFLTESSRSSDDVKHNLEGFVNKLNEKDFASYKAFAEGEITLYLKELQTAYLESFKQEGPAKENDITVMRETLQESGVILAKSTPPEAVLESFLWALHDLLKKSLLCNSR